MSHHPAQPGRFVLASASPRRRDLLAAVLHDFEIAAVELDETLEKGASAGEAVERLALAKACAVARHSPNALVIAADTLVSRDGEPLGKPAGAGRARAMLRALRGADHEVLTAVCVLSGDTPHGRIVSTRVQMRPYTDTEIQRSIRRGTPFDKAGGYAIQDEEFRPVASFEGCYCNVVGLPLWTVFELLTETGFTRGLQTPDRSRAVCSACPLRPEPQPRSVLARG